MKKEKLHPVLFGVLEHAARCPEEIISLDSHYLLLNHDGVPIELKLIPASKGYNIHLKVREWTLIHLNSQYVAPKDLAQLEGNMTAIQISYAKSRDKIEARLWEWMEQQFVQQKKAV